MSVYALKRSEDFLEGNSQRNNKRSCDHDLKETAHERESCEEASEVAITMEAFKNLVLSDRQIRKEELLAKLKSIKKKYEIYAACYMHRGIIRQSIQRNLELIVLYLDFCTQAGSDKRLQRTCELYQRLSRELEEANKKLMELDESLAAKSSMDRASYEMESQKINLELERLRFSEGDEDEGDSDDKDDPGE
jgi:biopolymer transport protein ExbD